MDPRSTHCPYCGARLLDALWPKLCAGCGRISFVNPLPVAVLLLPVGSGVLLIRRGIEPGRGQLALPGGFIDLGESWEEAAARELQEETGIDLDPIDIRHLRTASSSDGRLILIFGEASPMREEDLAPFIATAETIERTIASSPIELAFPLHTEALTTFFARRKLS